jgi:acetyl/propionyl-CoA carboxylase alpha subunit
VQWQLRVANGEELTIAQNDVRPRGWAIETRIYAEDPANHMLPSTGTITRWSPPEGPGIRVDAGVTTGSEVSVFYDPMLAKLIVFGTDRPHAITRLEHALEDFTIDGVRANVPLLLWIARDDAFRAGDTTTSFIPQRLDESIFTTPAVPREAALLATASLLVNGGIPWRLAGIGMPVRLHGGNVSFAWDVSKTNDPRSWRVDGDCSGDLRVEGHGDALRAAFAGETIEGAVDHDANSFVVALNGRVYRLQTAPPPSAEAMAGSAAAATDGRISAPMPGKIVKIVVGEGEAVEEHALLVVLEAMKMEHRIESSTAGSVKAVLVKEGQIVAGGAPLIEIA